MSITEEPKYIPDDKQYCFKDFKDEQFPPDNKTIGVFEK